MIEPRRGAPVPIIRTAIATDITLHFSGHLDSVGPHGLWIFAFRFVLKTLDDDELQAFCNLLTRREIAPKEKIITEGAGIHAFHIVCEGTVHARRMAQKREVLLGRIGKGGFFGEVNLFDAGLATASVYAVDKVTLAIVDYETLRTFMQSNPAIGYKIVAALMSEISRRLRQTNDRFVNSLYWSSLSTTPAAES